MRDVWGTTFWTSSKTIDVHLGWVRRKFGDDSRRPRLITTIRGQGLRFETENHRVDG
jgi:DNA-binding response OmpR family regulator